MTRWLDRVLWVCVVANLALAAIGVAHRNYSVALINVGGAACAVSSLFFGWSVNRGKS